ncbi:MAG: hypothetical protein ABIJ57_13665 [Pseudomonadota bacterium]
MEKERIIKALEDGDYEVKFDGYCGCSHGWKVLSDGTLEYDGDSDECWIGHVLYVDGTPIAEDVQFEASRVLVNDIDDDDIPEEIWDEMRTGDKEDNDYHQDSMGEALIDWIKDEGYRCYREDGRFANEYSLTLVKEECADAYESDNEDDETMSPEDWVDAYYRYPDPITESYVATSVVDQYVVAEEDIDNA